jgi:hypothetical protein
MKTNTILIIISAFVVVAGVYWYYSTQTENEPPLTTGTAENLAQARFQSLVRELQSVSFDTSIFSNPNFKALIDLATPIMPETAGRIDPFAPVPGVSGK